MKPSWPKMLHGPALNLHGTCMDTDLPCSLRRAVWRHAVGRARDGGASLKGFDSHGLGTEAVCYDPRRRCTPEGVRRIVKHFAIPPHTLCGWKCCGKGVRLLSGQWLLRSGQQVASWKVFGPPCMQSGRHIVIGPILESTWVL